MEIKAYLSVAGLACDLIGAFLLSIPMVWHVNMAVGYLNKLRKNIDKINIHQLRLIIFLLSVFVFGFVLFYINDAGIWLIDTHAGAMLVFVGYTTVFFRGLLLLFCWR